MATQFIMENIPRVKENSTLTAIMMMNLTFCLLGFPTKEVSGITFSYT